MDYETLVKKELALWEKKMLKNTGVIEGFSRDIQKKLILIYLKRFTPA